MLSKSGKGLYRSLNQRIGDLWHETYNLKYVPRILAILSLPEVQAWILPRPQACSDPHGLNIPCRNLWSDPVQLIQQFLGSSEGKGGDIDKGKTGVRPSLLWLLAGCAGIQNFGFQVLGAEGWGLCITVSL